MNAQAILQKIEEDALQTVETTLAEAQKKAAVIRSTSKSKIESARNETAERAEEESLLLEDRMRRVAQLDKRKQELEGKRRLLDECFAQALEDARKLPLQQLRELFLEQSRLCVCGGEEMLLGDKLPEWYDDGFLQELNSTLDENPVTMCTVETCSGTGLELRKNGSSVRITLENLMAEKRQHLETEVAEILFHE